MARRERIRRESRRESYVRGRSQRLGILYYLLRLNDDVGRRERDLMLEVCTVLLDHV